MATSSPTRRLGSAAAWPVVARAQQSAMPVIGFLSPQSADDPTNYTVAFLQGLKEIGYVAGQNVAVEYRYAENQFERLPAFAADLVRRRVAVIVAAGTIEGRCGAERGPHHSASALQNAGAVDGSSGS